MTAKISFVEQFNQLKQTKKPTKKNVAKGPVDLKMMRAEIKEKMKPFRRPN